MDTAGARSFVRCLESDFKESRLSRAESFVRQSEMSAVWNACQLEIRLYSLFAMTSSRI